MFMVRCSVEYRDTFECYTRDIDWDDQYARRLFAQKADQALRDGGIVTTEPVQDNKTC